MSMFAWRAGARARKPIFRLLPLIVLAFAISAAFGVASIFSSNVTSETLNQVLLKGTRCAAMDSSKGSVYKQLTQLLPYHAARATQFLNYGMQCYTNETHADGCNTYLKPRLPLVSTRGIPCPFGDGVCKLDNDNLMMDTGYLDSLHDLGINSAPEDRFQLRIVNKCAPLKSQGYTKDFNDSTYGAVKQAMYGPVETVKGHIDWTYQVPVDNVYVPENGNSSSANIPRLEYQLGIQQHYATPNESLLQSPNNYSPIPALHLDDADVHLAFLSAPQIHFSNPIDDPWFSAQTSTSKLHENDSHQQLDAYLQDEPVSTMACTEQVQYCNPNLPEGQRCEPLRGILDPRASARLNAIFPSASQFAALKWADFIWTGSIYTISATLGFIGASALRARYSLSYGFSGPLPSNQWQLEAEHWVKAELASLQDVFVTAANGMPAILDDFRVEPNANETVAQSMCVNQKIVSTSFSSFNVLGISLILVLGALIIVLDMCLEPCVASCVRRKYAKRHAGNDEEGGSAGEKHPLHSVVEWNQTGTLQLQRLAHEEAGFGTWEKCDGDVPVTAPGQFIAGLDLRDTKHPLLMQQKVTPVSVWGDVVPLKAWGVGRSDTGVETLVEDAKAEKEGEKLDLHENPMPMTFHAISASTAERDVGLGVQMQDTSVEESRGEEWRALR
jgi:hypothetical protein